MAGAGEKLRMSGICKAFPGVRALDDVSLEVSAGEIVGLVGVNGAGKSTLMNILGGILQADRGEIAIDGQVVAIHSPKDADRHGIAFIHQELLFFSSLTVAENIFIAHLPANRAVPLFVSHDVTNAKARQILAMLGSGISATAEMAQLSVGEKQIVEIARALAMGADIIILDEPTSSLSIKEKDMLFGMIRRLKAEGKAIIYISHFLDEIMDLCDSFVVLRNGLLAGRGRVQDTTKNTIIRMVAGRDVLATRRSDRVVPDDPVLEVKGLRIANLLDDVGFALNRGEVLGIWGLMGSGRTELVRAILGLDDVDALSISLATDGGLQPIAPAQLLGHCGYITENRRVDGLFSSEPVWKNITATNLGAYAVGWLRFLDVKREAAVAVDHIDTMQIRTPSHTTKVENLSGGNQQKVIFSKWLDRKPAILVLDEPTRGVDVAAKQEIGNLVTALARGGTATLLITSEVEEMVALSDRVLVLRDGRIAHEVVGDAIDEATLMALALGED